MDIPKLPDIYSLLAEVRMWSNHVSWYTSEQIIRNFNGIQTQPPSDLVWDMHRPPETITGKILNTCA